MMSDTDDTDVLLLIPPDLFAVHSEDDGTEESVRDGKSAVVSELIEQVQSLESRVSAIECKDSPDNSLSHTRLSLDSTMNYRQTLPRTKFSASLSPGLQKSPSKHYHPQAYSSPTSATNSITTTTGTRLYQSNDSHCNLKTHGNEQSNALTSNLWNKHETSQTAFQSKPSSSHAGAGSSEKPPRSMLLSALNVCDHAKSYSSLPLTSSPNKFSNPNVPLKRVKDMNLAEVEDLLERIENRDRSLDSRKSKNEGHSAQVNFKKPLSRKSYLAEKTEQEKKKMDQHKLKFNINGHTHSHESVYQSDNERKKDASDLTLHNDSSFSSFDTEKFMADFKPSYEPSESKISLTEPIIFEENEKSITSQAKEQVLSPNENDAQSYVPINTDYSLNNKRDDDLHHHFDTTLVSRFTEEITKSQTISPSIPAINQNAQMTSCKSCPSIFKTPSNVSISNARDNYKKPEFSNNVNGSSTKSYDPNHTGMANNFEQRQQRPQRLLTLSDFWNQDSSKSQEEQLKIKLEEEKLRREHCEKMIQELQKKLLEQQEKIAVAIRVDDEKNLFISQFQVSWKKMKQRLLELDSERENLQKLIKSISEKHQVEIAECQEQIKRSEEELSKALNLATGYKEKSDSLVKEKLDLLKSHADELEGYKSLVQQAESRYEEMKKECQKLAEKNQQTDEALKAVQQDFNKELIKSSEVKSELAIIHSALDTCEAELAILRQEKDNLQLKLKEELGRNGILEQGRAALKAAADEAKKAEKLAKNEIKSLTEQQEKLRAELREVYQKQVDEVVKAKLQEFQKQLDSAEMIFQNELETKQRAIAEIAARKIKNVIDKHQLEINLVEEKHKEEKKLFEVKLAQETQKSAMLEAQLNTYRKSKTNIVEQLHSMMQKQWQQALLIISGGNLENLPALQQINVGKLFENPIEPNFDSGSKSYNTSPPKPVKLERKKSLNLQNIQNQDHQDEGVLTLNDETPVTSRQESNNDFQKYIKMILDMQRSQEDYSKPKFFQTSPSLSHKENLSNQVQKEINTSNDGNSTWQPISEASIHDTSEYLSVPQTFGPKTDQYKQKPPWK